MDAHQIPGPKRHNGFEYLEPTHTSAKFWDFSEISLLLHLLDFTHNIEN